MWEGISEVGKSGVGNSEMESSELPYGRETNGIELELYVQYTYNQHMIYDI